MLIIYVSASCELTACPNYVYISNNDIMLSTNKHTHQTPRATSRNPGGTFGCAMSDGNYTNHVTS
jgi:hypothetical protein